MQTEKQCPIGDCSTMDMDQQWDQDARNPYNWPLWKKWMVMVTGLAVTFCAGMNSTAITTASEALSKEFNIRSGVFEYSFFDVTAWNAAAAFVPLAALPIMETYGMRLGYLTAYTIFTIFLVPQALAQNFTTVIVCRAIGGAAGGTLQNAADGVAANVFRTSQERVGPVTVYVFSLVLGVTMGPVLGAVVKPLGWRWIFWIELIINGALIPLVFFGMKETRGALIRAKVYPVALEKTGKTEALRTFRETAVRSAILLTTEPTVTSFTVWSAFSYGLVFIMSQSVPLVFTGTYAWPNFSGGLVQVSIGIGQFIGLLGCFLQNIVYVRSAPRNPEKPGVPVPEAILHLSIPSTIIALAGGLFMYGWSTLQPHWIVTAVGLALVGYAIMVVVNAASIYLTDAYTGYAASAIGALAFGENTFAAFLPLAAKPMYVRLGYPWASSLLAFIAVALALAPFTLLIKGKAIRDKSKAIKKMGIS